VLRFKNLGSGSTGNATLVLASGIRSTRLLIDCGLGLKQLALRLAEAETDVSPSAAKPVDAIFITHEHGDHIGCARQFALRYRIPLWMSHGTYTALGSPDLDGLLHIAADGQAIDLGELQVTPFTVPHDAREPLQLTCNDGNAKLGVLTDLGHSTPHVLAHLTGCHALLLECNHDTDLLAKSSYPTFLKKRVGGPYGHLSNTAAADIAVALGHLGLTQLVAAHLSAQNNSPSLALQTLLSHVAPNWGGTEVSVAHPTEGTRWIQVGR
jgi:phosphoribosyl 1,2-cyclic phosphodiesterase